MAGEEMYEPTAEGLIQLLKRLRAPDGCPWDRAQTRETLGRSLAGETAELLDAIDRGSAPEICDELGDVLMNALFQIVLAREKGEFTAEDVFRGSTLAEALFGHEFFVDFSLRSVLQNEVDTLLIPEISIHSQNIAMSISQQF